MHRQSKVQHLCSFYFRFTLASDLYSFWFRFMLSEEDFQGQLHFCPCCSPVTQTVLYHRGFWIDAILNVEAQDSYGK
jgi:hypothetical protein